MGKKTIYGYASTDGQTLDAQIAASKAAGAERVFSEKQSGDCPFDHLNGILKLNKIFRCQSKRGLYREHLTQLADRLCQARRTIAQRRRPSTSFLIAPRLWRRERSQPCTSSTRGTPGMAERR
jgi:hypothetical protein